MPATPDVNDVRIAAIDIGSNSVRQFVADVSPLGRIHVVDEMKTMPRLGKGLESTGRLSAGAIDAAVSAVQRMVSVADQLGAIRIVIVATSAVRDASNSVDFTSRLTETTGHPVRVLSGEEEALLSFSSAQAHFDIGTGRAVVMDIGGGSLELVLARDGLIERMASLPYGALRLTERFLASGIRSRRVRTLRKHVRAGIKEALPVKDWRGAIVIGAGGTFTNLAGMVLARHRMLVRSPHGTRVSRVELEHILEWLQSLSSEERQCVAGLNPARSDIIVAGMAVAAEVLARFDPRDLLVSGYGIREGLLLEAAHLTPTAAGPGPVRERSIGEFAERCRHDRPHAQHVRTLALQLFDALVPRLNLTDSDRGILADAALLHDVGHHISYEKHHKHSFHLISHAELLGVTPTEQILIAHVARYHRGPPPKLTHRAFGQLERHLRDRIVRLSALLRFADGLDRGHLSAVAAITLNWTPDSLQVTTHGAGCATNVRLECWGASRKRQLLEQVLACRISVHTPDGVPVDAEDTMGSA